MSGDSSKGMIRLEVPVDLPGSTAVVLASDSTIQSGSSSSSGPSTPKTISLTTLPPILLDICLPRTYPYTPPQVRAVHATYSWLSLDGLREALAGKWEEGQGVLYTWVEWIRSGEFLEELGMSTIIEGRQTIRYVLDFQPSYCGSSRVRQDRPSYTGDSTALAGGLQFVDSSSTVLAEFVRV